MKEKQCRYCKVIKPLNKFSLDSKANFDLYNEFLDGETRYSSLAKVNPNKKDELYEANKNNAINRYKYYESLKSDK